MKNPTPGLPFSMMTVPAGNDRASAAASCFTSFFVSWENSGAF